MPRSGGAALSVLTSYALRQRSHQTGARHKIDHAIRIAEAISTGLTNIGLCGLACRLITSGNKAASNGGDAISRATSVPSSLDRSTAPRGIAFADSRGDDDRAHGAVERCGGRLPLSRRRTTANRRRCPIRHPPFRQSLLHPAQPVPLRAFVNEELINWPHG